MRFHFGVSLSWRVIKKYLLYILLGLFGIFGFSLIYENKNNIPFHLLTYKEALYEVSSEN